MKDDIYNLALCLEYDGSRYNGWQYQHGYLTIQNMLENAINKIACHPVSKLSVAGRTDAGVHAINQVVSFNTTALRREYNWQCGINFHLPYDIRVKWVCNVPIDFDARASAKNRHYKYIIYNDKTRPALLLNNITWVFPKLDIMRMQQAALYLIGEHDFTSFRAADCQSKSAMRSIYDITIQQHHKIIIIEIKANAFLHHMVRNIVGVLVKIGQGAKDIIWAKNVLLAKDRKAAAMTMPPNGLYLYTVNYPERYNLPTTSQNTTTIIEHTMGL